MSADWPEVTLGSVTSWLSGGTPNKGTPSFWNGDIPWISANSMYGTRFYDSDLKITKSGLSAGSRLAPTNSILLLVRGGALHNRLPVGIACRELAFNQDVKALIAASHRLDPWFLLYWLVGNERFLLNEVVEETGIGAGKLDTKRMQALPMKLPPVTSQRRIAQVAQSLDEKIDLNRRINQTLEDMAQAIFESWFVDFDPVNAKMAAKASGRDPLRAAMSAISGKADAELDALQSEQYEQLAATAALFPDEMEASELGEIPKGWSHKPLLHLTDKIGSGSTPRGGKEVYLEEGVSLIRSQNVYDSLFVWDGLARISDEAAAQLKGVTVQEEDVLLNITGASILRTCIVEPDVLPARVNQHVAIIRAKAGVPPRFIHMHLLRTDIKNYLLGLNAGASREAITKAHIESLVLLTPGPELLSAFQTAISPLLQQVHCLTRQMRALGELRDTLLPKLLSGELTVASLVENFEAA